MEAILNDKKSKRFLDEIGKFGHSDFKWLRNELMPVIDYTLYLVDNYDNPKKMAVDFETFCKNRTNENENQKKYFRFITNSKNESR